MRKRLLLATFAVVFLSSVPAPAASEETPSITVTATVASQDVVQARIEVCPDECSNRCYGVLRRVTKGEVATLDSFLSFETKPFPSLLGELSITPDGKSLEYRLEYVSGVVSVASVTGSVSLAGE